MGTFTTYRCVPKQYIVLCGSNVLHVLEFYINGIVEYVFPDILPLSLNVVYESSMLI